MKEEHHIVFIEAISEDKNNIQLKYLHSDEEPKMIFNKTSEKMIARELCNIHGLWEGEND